MKETTEPMYKVFEKFVIKSLVEGKHVRSLSRLDFEAFAGLKDVNPNTYTQYKMCVVGNYKAGPRLPEEVRRKYPHLLGHKPGETPKMAGSARKGKEEEVTVASPVVDHIEKQSAPIDESKYIYSALASRIKSYVDRLYPTVKAVDQITYQGFCAATHRPHKPQDEETSFILLRDKFFKQLVEIAETPVAPAVPAAEWGKRRTPSPVLRPSSTAHRGRHVGQAEAKTAGSVSYRTLDFTRVGFELGGDVLALIDAVLGSVSADAGKKYAVVHTKHPMDGLELRVYLG